jgi:hypothetical protein
LSANRTFLPFRSFLADCNLFTSMAMTCVSFNTFDWYVLTTWASTVRSCALRLLILQVFRGVPAVLSKSHHRSGVLPRRQELTKVGQEQFSPAFLRHDFLRHRCTVLGCRHKRLLMCLKWQGWDYLEQVR